MSTLTELAKQIELTAADTKTACKVATSAERDANAIIDAIRARILDEEVAASKEVARLKEAISDRSRTATAVKMDQLALERAEAFEAKIHPEELQLFTDKISEAESALQDWRTSEKALRDLLDQMRKCLEDLRPSKLNAGLDTTQASQNIRITSERLETLKTHLKEMGADAE